jgi:hypothetical protein
MAERTRQAVETGGTPFARLDAVLSGGGASHTPDGLRYEDPVALARAEVDRVRRLGLVH